MFRKTTVIFLFITCFALLESCDQPPCADSDGVQLNAGFYQANGISVKDTAIKNLTTWILGQDETASLSKIMSDNYKIMYLPLSKTSDTSVFVLNFDTLGTDTLTLHYTRELKLISHECGFDFFFELSRAKTTTHVIDSVWIRKAYVEYGEQENVKIFF